jgi:hypothetical protein
MGQILLFICSERRDELVDMLGVDFEWRMQQHIDNVNKTCCVGWLMREYEERGATIIYETHFFDGVDVWATLM